MLAVLAVSAVVACGGTLDQGDAGDDSGSNPDVSHPLPGCDAIDVDAGTVGCGGKNVQLSGDVSKCELGDASPVPQSTCVAICGGSQYAYCTFDSSTNILECQSMCTGRLPAFLREPMPSPDSDADAVGDYLARAAYLEAAAVDAFAILADELRAHGAPRSLVRSAQRARADEVRHAREVGALARAFGAEVATPEVGRTNVRPLAEIALENAVEGCVRETFGALLAEWQAAHARDPRVRATMKRVARDETRHAALGWRIFDWAEGRLGAADRARIERAMSAAVSELERSLRREPDRRLAETLGLPSAARALALLASMRGELWADAA